MSKLILIIALFIIGMLCWHFLRRDDKPSGSGRVISQHREVKPFTHLKLDGVFTTIITQDGGAAWVKIEADDNLQKHITVTQDGDVVKISSTGQIGLHGFSRMVVHVNVRDLRSLDNETVGTVETNGTIKCTDLHWTSNAVGKTTLNIEANTLTANLNTVGEAILIGKADSVEINYNSVGKLDASKLHAGTLRYLGNGIGAAYIYAERELYINNNGIGSLHYAGNAKVQEINQNGIGKVSKE